MKRIAILGSTGSVGQNTLRVIASLGDKFRVVGLSAYSNATTLLKQARQFKPGWICLVDEFCAKRARASLPASCRLLSGRGGLQDLIQKSRADAVVLAVSGAEALMPLFKAVSMKKTVILANKEALVMAGSIIMPLAARNGVGILPVDSEQSAIWQCLENSDKKQLRRVYLTASGGPFKNYNSEQLKSISISDVLRHPRWNMGRRITVDSATLMNKGLEIIEAMWLFDVDLSRIEVVIQPEAVVHSMVEFIDGTILAQLSIADMRIPIQYALTYPQRFTNKLKPLDFFKLRNINFQKPNLRRFPCLRLAIDAAREGGSMPCVLNAADEVAVGAFLERRIQFTDIPKTVARITGRHKKIDKPSLKEILAVDAWARTEAKKLLGINEGVKKNLLKSLARADFS
ncbi:MAG: 1-deoxy-D-xylulose-5-phosphate reductoisomerase [Candidatus Omnitrophota bacterium]